MKKLVYILLITILALTLATPALADKPTGFDAQGKATGLTGDTGFDAYGYNYNARLFSGPATGWCLKKYGYENCLGIYSNDHLVMKWSQAWADAKFGPDGVAENGDELPWTTEAWVSNQWNGMVPGGSGEAEHVKIVWVGPCGAEFQQLPDGGYCIWGQFEAIFDHYVGQNNNWWAKVAPAGYGTYK